MKCFDRKGEVHVSRASEVGQVERKSARETNERTYATQETLRRSAVKVAKEHRPALEWLADK